jgi:hypothetical protein
MKVSADTNVWDRLQSTHNPYTADYEVSGQLPFGLFKRLKSHWITRGSGTDARYVLSVTEENTQGRLAKTDPFMTAVLHKVTAAWEGYGSMTTTYAARLVAGELVSVHGHVVEFDNVEDEPIRQADGSTVTSLTPEEALTGFEASLAIARFD